MTWKNGSTYSSTAATATGVDGAEQPRPANAESDGAELSCGAPTNDGNRTADSTAEGFKARSVKLLRRSRKKGSTLRRRTNVPPAPAGEKGCGDGRRAGRVVHFDVPADEGEERTDFVRLRPFRRSSKFRQPLKRVSRAKGSPPPSCLARIHQILDDPFADGKLPQPNFNTTSDGESEEEEEEEEDRLPPSLLESLRSDIESEGEGSSDETCAESYATVLPATTVEVATTWEEDGGVTEPRHDVASNPLARRGSRRTSTARAAGPLARRRSSYRNGVPRRGSRASLRTSSVRRPSADTARRCSIVTRRRSSGYIYRRRSVELRSPYRPTPLFQRKKRRNNRRRRPRKIVVMGDMCSGKTSLISAYSRDKFSDVYVPTILTSCMTDADVLGEKIDLVIVEVAGRTDYKNIRRCAYHKMDLVLLCYSADKPSSLAAIRDHWLPELMKVSPQVPYILVGTKKDIREEHACEVKPADIRDAKNPGTSIKIIPCDDEESQNKEQFVSTRQGWEVAESIGAHDFIECSAMYRDGTREVFETAAKLALRRSPRRKKKHIQRAETCTIL